MNRKMSKLFSLVLTFVMVLTTALTDYIPVQETQAATQTQETAVQAGNSYGLADNIQDGVILHCFNWTYNDIKTELPAIAEAGFTSVQTSPAQMGAGTGAWYWLYQPLGFYIGSNNGLGTKDELKALCTEAHKYGINVIVDVVANHLAGSHDNIQNDLKDGQYWHTYDGNIDYNNRWQITHGKIGMPDINSEHSYVQQVVKNYIQELKSLGVDGFRWDAAKHISLPSEDCDFWENALDNTTYNYGEILKGAIDNGDCTALMQEYTNYMSITDSSYGKDIREAFRDGRVPTSIGNWCARNVAKNKLVYWAESHDTYSNNGEYGEDSRTSTQNQIDRAYAIVASQNDATALYFSRPFETVKDNIKIGVKGSTAFKSKEVAAVNHFHNAMVGQREYYVPENNCAAVCREGGAVIVAASGSDFEVSITNGGSTTAPGTYYDEITGNEWTVTSTTIKGKIGSSGIAVIYDAPAPVPSATVSKGEAGKVTNYTSDTLELTIGLRNATQGTYSIDGGSQVTFTADKKITIGEGKNVGDKTTLTLTATDGSTTSQPVTYTYMKVEPSNNVAYLDLPSGWGEPYCYVYEKIDGTTKKNATWPGVKMEKVSGSIYKYEVGEEFSTPSVIFTDNNNQYPGANQDGLVLSGSMIYQSGSWKEYSVVTEGSVIVKYVDEAGKEIATSTTLKGTIGAAYTATAKTVEGYTLKTTPSNATGKYASSTITVTFVYQVEDNSPRVTSSVASGTSFNTETKKITLTLENATSGTYSVDNGPVKKFTGSADVVIGQGKVGDSKVTVDVTATNGSQTKNYTFTYSKIFNKTVDETKDSALTQETSRTTASSQKLASQYSTSGVSASVAVAGSTPITEELELNFGADKSAPQTAGTTLTLTGDARGGKSSYTYKFYVNDNLVETKTAAGKVTTSWTPSKAGTYVIKCVVTDAENKSKTSAKYYTVEGTEVLTGWVKADGKWYYYSESGEMQTGWVKADGKWYYMSSNGDMQTGWIKVNGKWYYMSSNGDMQTGWIKVSGKWYYMSSNGDMQTGWLKLDGKWYYMSSNGDMKTGWQYINGKWYYMEASGVMQSSKWIKGKYYMKEDGSMAVSEWVDGNRYYVDANGVWVPNYVAK